MSQWDLSFVFCQWNYKSFLPISAMEASVQLSTLSPPLLYPGCLSLHDYLIAMWFIYVFKDMNGRNFSHQISWLWKGRMDMLDFKAWERPLPLSLIDRDDYTHISQGSYILEMITEHVRWHLRKIPRVFGLWQQESPRRCHSRGGNQPAKCNAIPALLKNLSDNKNVTQHIYPVPFLHLIRFCWLGSLLVCTVDMYLLLVCYYFTSRGYWCCFRPVCICVYIYSLM